MSRRLLGLALVSFELACGGRGAPARAPEAPAALRGEPFATWEARTMRTLAGADARLAARFHIERTQDVKAAAVQDAITLGIPVSLWEGGPDLFSWEYRRAVLLRIVNFPKPDVLPSDAARYTSWNTLLSEELFRAEQEGEHGYAFYGMLHAWTLGFAPPLEGPEGDPTLDTAARTRAENDATLAKRLAFVGTMLAQRQDWPLLSRTVRFGAADIERKVVPLAYPKAKAALAELTTALEQNGAPQSTRPKDSIVDARVRAFSGDRFTDVRGMTRTKETLRTRTLESLNALSLIEKGRVELRTKELVLEPCTLQSIWTPPERALGCTVVKNLAHLSTLLPEERAATWMAAHDLVTLGLLAVELWHDPSSYRSLEDRSRFLSRLTWTDIEERVVATPETCVLAALLYQEILAAPKPEDLAERAVSLGLPPLSVLVPRRPPG